MLEEFQTIYRGGSAEIVEKKSRFIATVRLAETEDEALAFIESMKKQYWDARHNCYAYVIGERKELVRCSDDGEPGGTAGRPMLDVLLGADLYNVVVVVTRYFGGTLLGTGGLVRAYSKAVSEGLAACEIITRQYGTIFTIDTDYGSVGKIQYLLGERHVPTLSSTYTDTVQFQIILPAAEQSAFQKALTEATNGRTEAIPGESLYFAVHEGAILQGDALKEPAAE